MTHVREARSRILVALVFVPTMLLGGCARPEASTSLTVTVTPERLTIAAGDTHPFDAVVSGEGIHDDDVVWSLRHAAPDDRIDTGGVLTAGNVDPSAGARAVQVVATSVQDPAREGSALVTILLPPMEEPADVDVAVVPGSVTVEAGDSQVFEAVVSGDGVTDTSVTWSVRGGTPDDVVTADGVFTAGNVDPSAGARAVQVVATSVQDPTAEGTATVAVQPPAEPPDPELDVVLTSFAEEGNVAPSVVRLDATGSSSDRGAIVAYHWLVDGVARDRSGPVLDVYLAHAGLHTVTVTIEDSAGNRASGEETIVLAAAPSPFTIDVRFFDDEGMTLSQRRAFSSAARRWAEVVTTDFEPLAYGKPAGACGVPEAFDGVIDDLLIYASISAIDGPGGILAQAGPCDVDLNLFPLYGVMQFDVADLAALEGNADLGGVILHEMGHVLGIGTLWEFDSNAFIDPVGCFGAPDPRFTGANAVQEWQGYGGSGQVPVQAGTTPDGTACGHWRETTASEDLFNELMTGFLDASMDLSRITIGSLDDMGYTVDYGAADPFTLFPALAGRAASADRELRDRLIVPDLDDPHPARR